VDGVDVAAVGPLFEHAACFPQRINTEFIRVVNPATIKMRVWERGSGETLACGSGACAAAVAAITAGQCARDTDITVKAAGGDLIVRVTDQDVTLTGETRLVYRGSFRC
jgi:carbamoyl-phosphate synthase large subunit